MRLLTRHEPANMTRLGLDVVAAGVAFGLVVLVVFAIARIGTAGTSRPPAATAHHRRGTAGPQPAAASREYGKAPGRGTSQGHRQDQLRAGAQAAGRGHGGGRSGRSPVLNPTNVYTPGGLLDMPRDGRAPRAPAGQDIPEILRTAGAPPRPGASGAPAAGAPPGWAGAKPPRPGYQPGMNPGGPGRAPYPPPMPPRDHMRPREAPRPGHAMPPREAPRPGHAGPPRDAGCTARCRLAPRGHAAGGHGLRRPGPSGRTAATSRPRSPDSARPGPTPAARRRSRLACGRSRLRRSGRPQARSPRVRGTSGTRWARRTC